MKREKIKEILKNGKPGRKSLKVGKNKKASKNVPHHINDGSAIFSLR